jgi:hypothetical protein
VVLYGLTYGGFMFWPDIRDWVRKCGWSKKRRM